MFASLFWTLAALAAGGGGLWIAALFVPTLAAVLSSLLKFLASPFGMICGAAAGVVILFSAGWIAGDIHGSEDVRAAWHAADAAIKQQADNRDANVEHTAKVEADTTIATIDADAANLAAKVKDYETSHHDRPACPASGNDVRRLLDIH